MFTELQENLAAKLSSMAIADEELRSLDQITDAVAWIKSKLVGGEFVVFCGAGISIPGRSAAPGFVDLRDNLVIATIENLRKRDVIDSQTTREVVEAVERLPISKQNFPPEMIFSSLRESLGDEVLANVLACLDQGKPNENHMGIRRLAERPNSRLVGVITTNFDSYIETAFEGMPHTIHLPDDSEGDAAFPVVKPHGSLNKMSSILITLEELYTPLGQSMTERIQGLVSNRTLLVIGYSGMDYDLFPLLVHAGRYWNTRIWWVLWNQDALNSQVRKLQLALGDKCTVLDGQERNVLAELNDLGMSTYQGKDLNLANQLTEATRNCATVDLINAFMELLGPIGIPNYPEILERVLEAQLIQLREYGSDFDVHRLNLILQVAKFSASKELKTSATELGKSIAMASHDDQWLRQFRYHESVEPQDEEGPDAELKDIEFSLSSNFFPYLERYNGIREARLRRYMTLSQLRRKAELLSETEAYDEAEDIARGLLASYHFPETGISEDAAFYDEPVEEARLRYVLVRILIERGEKEEAERELCHSLDILWRELNLFEFGYALSIAQELLAGSLVSNRCIAMAHSLAVEVDRLDGNFNDELEDLVAKLESGFGDEQDLARAKLMLPEAKHSMDDEEHRVLKDRMQRAEQTWFRAERAVFLKRMLPD